MRRGHASLPPTGPSAEIAGTGEAHRDRGLPSTVEPVTTVLVTAMVLVAVMFVVVVATLALAARAHRRRQLDDARAEARHWVERLGGELLVLDGAAARLGTGTAAGLAEAAERFTAAGAELAAARTPRQCRIAQDTAVEGLHHVRTARRSLGLDPGPRVPGQGVGGVLRAALQDGDVVHPEAGRRRPCRGPRACPPVARRHRWSLPSGSAGDSSAGCARSQFVADRNEPAPPAVWYSVEAFLRETLRGSTMLHPAADQRRLIVGAPTENRHDPPTRPRRRRPPRISAGRTMCAGFRAPTGSRMVIVVLLLRWSSVLLATENSAVPPGLGLSVRRPTSECIHLSGDRRSRCVAARALRPPVSVGDYRHEQV